MKYINGFDLNMCWRTEISCFQLDCNLFQNNLCKSLNNNPPSPARYGKENGFSNSCKMYLNFPLYERKTTKQLSVQSTAVSVSNISHDASMVASVSVS